MTTNQQRHRRTDGQTDRRTDNLRQQYRAICTTCSLCNSYTKWHRIGLHNIVVQQRQLPPPLLLKYSWAPTRGAQLTAGYTVNTYSKPPLYYTLGATHGTHTWAWRPSAARGQTRDARQTRLTTNQPTNQPTGQQPFCQYPAVSCRELLMLLLCPSENVA